MAEVRHARGCRGWKHDPTGSASCLAEGPFELLWTSLSGEEVSIWDIPIARITDQYLEYLSVAEVLDLHCAADFLVMAATADPAQGAQFTAAAEGPDPDEPAEPDPREELAPRLLDYRRYYLASVRLGELRRRLAGAIPGESPRPKLEVHYSQPVGSATPGSYAASG